MCGPRKLLCPEECVRRSGHLELFELHKSNQIVAEIDLHCAEFKFGVSLKSRKFKEPDVVFLTCVKLTEVEFLQLQPN